MHYLIGVAFVRLQARACRGCCLFRKDAASTSLQALYAPMNVQDTCNTPA